MADALHAAAVLALLTVLAGLVRVVRGPTRADRMLAAQLLGTGGMAVLLLLAAAGGGMALLDLALVLAVLAAFAAAAFVQAARR